MANADPLIEVEVWEGGIEEYTVELQQYSLTAYSRLDDSEFSIL